MKVDCINSIDITTNNNDIISISSSDFSNFYIANIDSCGNETNYIVDDKKNLIANFFMIKIIYNQNNTSSFFINRLFNKKDIISINVKFNNGSSQNFIIPRKRVKKNGILENTYENAFINNNDLCILITDKNLRYEANLFA